MSNNLKERTIGSLFWKLAERSGNAIVQMIVQIIMARLLSPDAFGTLSIMLVFINLANIFVQSGLNTALVQTPDVTDEDYSTVFWMSSSISALLFLIIFFSAPAIASFYSMPFLVYPLRLLDVLLLISPYAAVLNAIIQRSLEMKAIFVGTLVACPVSAACGIVTAICGGGVWALVLQQLAYQVVNTAVLALQVKWRPRPVFKVYRARRLFAFGSRLLVSGILEQGYQGLSDLIIGRQFSGSILGYVSQGKKYPQAIGSLLDGSIQPVMLSAVSRVQSDAAVVKSLVRRALKTSTFVIFPSMMLLAVIAPTLVPLLLGSQWSSSVWFMQVYCIVYAFLPIHTTNLQALNGMGHSNIFLKLEVIKKAYGIVFLLFGAFVLCDVRVIVASYLLSDVISTFINAYPNRVFIGYSYVEQLRDIGPSLLMSCLASLIVLPIQGLGLFPALTIIMQVILFLITYFAASRIARLEELEYLLVTVSTYLKTFRLG